MERFNFHVCGFAVSIKADDILEQLRSSFTVNIVLFASWIDYISDEVNEYDVCSTRTLKGFWAYFSVFSLRCIRIHVYVVHNIT